MHHKPDAIFLIKVRLDGLVLATAGSLGILPDKVVLWNSEALTAHTLDTELYLKVGRLSRRVVTQPLNDGQ